MLKNRRPTDFRKVIHFFVLLLNIIGIIMVFDFNSFIEDLIFLDVFVLAILTAERMFMSYLAVLKNKK